MTTSTMNPSPGMPVDLAKERKAGMVNGCVGTKLLSETDRVRVWTIALEPGERIGFHTHVLDYFWTAVTPGRGYARYGDGQEREVEYREGDIEHLTYSADESMMHDLTNIGDTRLVFITVEFLDSANSPLALPAKAATEARRANI